MSTPSSIVVVGSGVFGLSTAKALTERDEYKNSTITVLERLEFPAVDGSSVDSSRIVRADYADEAYARLMNEAHPIWRGEFGADGRYSENGLCIVSGKASSGEEALYLEKALESLRDGLGLKIGKKEDGDQVEVLDSPEDVKRAMHGMGGDCGKRGYINWTAGWANAEEGVRHMRRLIEKTGRVEFRQAEVTRLEFSNGLVQKICLANGEPLTADLFILATGAWTPKLIDLTGIATATGQCLAYIELTSDEQARLGDSPTLLCEDNGIYILPPRNNILKIARHGYGYANPIEIPHPELEGKTLTVSLPRTTQDNPDLSIPPEGSNELRDYMVKCMPFLANRPWKRTRICWYTDTKLGDFLVDYHPKYSNLFVATAGNGHGYKFLPVIGERIVDIIQRKDRDELGAKLRKKWRWGGARPDENLVWTEDWRGGQKGMILDDELAKK
ncbi:FAD dependent oxidoreductase [Piedraia hortae CBS 480.64]|uniref:FAD dependent oxidoreductase n=1 Tax=Piedraia hortae CBS 480.64 TaxID=1314780 RepID=A0A6A7C8B8_9PEZI|nr:FAD dependent oxidoreductase [Piedraia hortae CBS 480.64]